MNWYLKLKVKKLRDLALSNKHDPVKHPKHYTHGIEMWDYAYSQDLGFFEGNILKYITRWKHKNGLQDLYKAKAYLDRLIEHKENETKKS